MECVCEEDELCEYERKRLENIRRNCELLKTLGLPLPGSVVKTRVKRKQKSSRESSEEEEEWQPWMEENVKRRRSERIEHKQLNSTSNHFTLSDNNGELVLASKTYSGCKQQDSCSTDQQRKGFLGFNIDKVSASHPDVQFDIYQDSEYDEDDSDEESDFDFQGLKIREIKEALLSNARDRYPRRSTRRGYREEELSDEDEYLFCEDCNDVYHGDCPVHGPPMPFDEAGTDVPSLVHTSMPIPAQLTVKPSSIPSAGLGVFANATIASGVRMGPYKGRTITSDEMECVEDTSYMWEVKRHGQRAFYLDGSDVECSNWMRFINCARNEREQNLVAFQYRGQIFYRTFKEIHPGTELLVWYGEQYAKDLGISADFKQGHFTCKGCSRTFSDSRVFNIHLRSSDICLAANPQTFKCGRCQETFPELSQLQNHILQHELTEKPHMYCNEVKTHTPTGEKPHVCDYCGKAFKQSSTLKKHLLTHTGEKPHVCDYCGKAFNLSGNLKKHLLTHTGEKPHVCNYCGKAFNQSAHLKRHLLTHTGEKPHVCDYCGKAFNQSGDLKRHLLTHTGEKPHVCDYCGKAYSLSGNLKTHLLTHSQT